MTECLNQFTDKPIEDCREMAQITVVPELEDSVQADADAKTVSTGITQNNRSNVWIMAAVLVGLAIVMAGLVVYGKRKRD